MVDLKRLSNAMLRNDVSGIARELYQWKQCGFCETWCDAMQCRAPGCTAIGCPECLAFHSLTHLEDDPKDQRPI